MLLYYSYQICGNNFLEGRKILWFSYIIVEDKEFKRDCVSIGTIFWVKHLEGLAITRMFKANLRIIKTTFFKKGNNLYLFYHCFYLKAEVYACRKHILSHTKAKCSQIYICCNPVVLNLFKFKAPFFCSQVTQKIPALTFHWFFNYKKNNPE